MIFIILAYLKLCLFYDKQSYKFEKKIDIHNTYT